MDESRGVPYSVLGPNAIADDGMSLVTLGGIVHSSLLGGTDRQLLACSWWYV